jgi:hypothetical protein
MAAHAELPGEGKANLSVAQELGKVAFMKRHLHVVGGDPDAIAPGWVRYLTEADADFSGIQLTEAQKAELAEGQGVM